MWYAPKNLHTACSLIINAIPICLPITTTLNFLHSKQVGKLFYSHKEKLTLQSWLRYEAKMSLINATSILKFCFEVSFFRNLAIR